MNIVPRNVAKATILYRHEFWLEKSCGHDLLTWILVMAISSDGFSFLDGYCSTVQGLLDWFEVDLRFTELLFIQIDLCAIKSWLWNYMPLLQNIVSFMRLFWKETYHFKEPTNHSQRVSYQVMAFWVQVKSHGQFKSWPDDFSSQPCLFSSHMAITFGKSTMTCDMVDFSMGWLQLVGSLKLDASFAEYRLFYKALVTWIQVMAKSSDGFLSSSQKPWPIQVMATW